MEKEISKVAICNAKLLKCRMNVYIYTKTKNKVKTGGLMNLILQREADDLTQTAEEFI